jgi:hypothetical protein
MLKWEIRSRAEKLCGGRSLKTEQLANSNWQLAGFSLEMRVKKGLDRSVTVRSNSVSLLFATKVLPPGGLCRENRYLAFSSWFLAKPRPEEQLLALSHCSWLNQNQPQNLSNPRQSIANASTLRQSGMTLGRPPLKSTPIWDDRGRGEGAESPTSRVIAVIGKARARG